MDPLSITVSVATLISTCGRPCWELKQLKSASQMADSKLNSILAEVECFNQLLHHMSDTMQTIKADKSMRDTGHLGNHLRSICVCIADGIVLLGRLHETLRSVGKSSRLLDGVRKHFRLMSAADEISVYQSQIKSYRDTIQLSLQAVILWNQVSIRTSTENIPMSLNRLCNDIKGVARGMNKRLQYMGENFVPTVAYADELKRLQNQRKCVRAAAEVVSSASTNVVSDGLASTSAPSDFDNVLPPNPSESMLRWFSEAVPSVYEEPDATAESVYVRNGIVHGCAAPGMVDGDDIASIAFSTHQIEDSDSDGEMEAEIVNLQLAKGRTEMLSGNFLAAEKMLRNGLARLNHQRSRQLGTDLKLSVSQALLNTYTQQEKWEEAKEVTLERLAILSGHSFGSSNRYLDEALSLADVLLRLGDTVQARIYAKKCIKAYREQGALGFQGLERALDLMIAICRSEKNTVDEEAFQLLLSHSKGQDRPSLATKTSNLSKLSEVSEVSHRKILVLNSQVQVAQPCSFTDALADPYEMLWDEEPPSGTSVFPGETATQEIIETQLHSIIRFEDNHSAEQRSYTLPNEFSAVPGPSSLRNCVSADPEPLLDWQESNDLRSNQDTSSGQIEAYSMTRLTRGLDTQLNIDEAYPSPWNAAETVLESRFTRYDDNPVADDERGCQTLSSNLNTFQKMKMTKDDAAMGQLSMRFQERVSLDAFYNIADPEETLGVFPRDCGAEAQHQRGGDQGRDTAEPIGVSKMSICADMNDGSGLMVSATPSTLTRLFSSSEDAGEEYTESISDFSTVDLPSTIATTANLLAMTKLHDKITVLVIGEPLCGKTSLIWRFIRNESIPRPRMTTGTVPYVANVLAGSIEKSQVELVIWDTLSLDTDQCFEDIKTIQNIQCVVLCFSVGDPDLIANIDYLWLQKIHKGIPRVPIVLAALQKDLRDDARSPAQLRTQRDSLCSYSMGDQLRDRIGAVQYCECSATTGEGVGEVFGLAALEGIKFKSLKASKWT